MLSSLLTIDRIKWLDNEFDPVLVIRPTPSPVNETLVYRETDKYPLRSRSKFVGIALRLKTNSFLIDFQVPDPAVPRATTPDYQMLVNPNEEICLLQSSPGKYFLTTFTHF
jgi:hypothetical protein